MRNRYTLPFLLLALLATPLTADGPPDMPPQGSIYLSAGTVLDAAQSRQLTLNAHIAEFSYQPRGLEIACTIAQIEGETYTASIKLIGVRRGETLATLASGSFSAPGGTLVPGEDSLIPSIAGWSADGRFLLIREYHSAGDLPEQYLCADLGADPIRVLPVDLPVNAMPASTQARWSPSRTRILLTQFILSANHSYLNKQFLYDPARRKVVAIQSELEIGGWIDDTHLLLRDRKLKASRCYSLNLTTNQQISLAKLPSLPSEASQSRVSPVNPTLRLEDEPKVIQDSLRAATADCHALWVRRTQGLKKLSAMPIGITPGTDDTQAVWSPNGAQIAFVSHGDLCVTDLNSRPATSREKLAAGEHLTCEEERTVATDNLKQIGLAIMQYTQDYDEMWPPADNINAKLQPYAKDNNVFNLGSSKFIYQTPDVTTIAGADDVAHTVLGHYDTPCAFVTLYMDGHVKVTLKATNTAP